MRKLLLFILLIYTSVGYTQETATLTVSGTGKTKEEAKNNALRSALEQTYGVFVSSNTEIFNDQLIKDEIVSVTSGNIHNFKILSETLLPDNTYTNLVNVTVSVNKLKSFAESKGTTVTFDGGKISTIAKMEELNILNEEKTIRNVYEVVEKLVKVSYDYEIHTGKISAVKGNNSLYDINVQVTAKFNQNINTALDLLFNTIDYLDASNKNSSNFERETFCFKVNRKEKCLRSADSYFIINYLIDILIPKYSVNFEIDNGLKAITGEQIVSKKVDRNYVKINSEDFSFNYYWGSCIHTRYYLNYLKMEKPLYHREEEVRRKNLSSLDKYLHWINFPPHYTEPGYDGRKGPLIPSKGWEVSAKEVNKNKFIFKLKYQLNPEQISNIKEFSVKRIN